MRVPTHLGVTITGSRSVRYRSISNDADPLPMITAARSAAAGTPRQQDVPDLRPRAQVRRQAAAIAGYDAAQIHDARDPRGHGSIGEDARRLPVPLLEDAPVPSE